MLEYQNWTDPTYTQVRSKDERILREEGEY
jgi:hypothetical protein